MTSIRALAFALALAGTVAFAQAPAPPPPEAGASARLQASPRHGEWVAIPAGKADTVDAYVVYPERSGPAPVVIVVHEIFGLSDWVRSVADQLAAEGFLAVAPDYLSGKAPDGKGSRSLSPDAARALFANLDPAQILERTDAAAAWATALPSASKRYGIVGFCWGGGVAFSYATARPGLGAAVVYYGTSPAAPALAGLRAPVLGLYGGNDARVTSTVAPAAAELSRLGRRFESEVYPGAGHGFLRQQDGQAGANLAASQKAWPRTIAFLRETLGDAARGGLEGAGPAAAAVDDDGCGEICEMPPAFVAATP